MNPEPRFDEVKQDVDRWVRELTEAGWTKYRDNLFVWRCPNNGRLYRGPAMAWRNMKLMKGEKP